MKKNITELVLILDKSGSMAGLESDTIGGYNAMLQKQQKEPGEAIVTTVLFDDNYELLHDRIDIKDISPLTEKDYFVGGCTALLDAIGKTIHKIDNAQQHTSEEQKADKVVFVITTDGMENASGEYTYEKIRAMIKGQKEKYGWEFIFLGANIDAVATAASLSINADRAASYHADARGINLNYQAVSNAVRELRTKNKISGQWKDEIEADFSKRSEKK